MYCGNCGKQIENGKFCPYCGEKNQMFMDESSTVDMEKNRFLGRGIFKICFSFLIISFFCPIIQISLLGIDILSLSFMDLFVGLEYGGRTQELMPGVIVFLFLPLIGFIYLLFNKKSTNYGQISAIIGGITGIGTLLILSITQMGYRNSEAIGRVKFLLPVYLYIVIAGFIVIQGIKLDCLERRKQSLLNKEDVDELHIKKKSIKSVVVCIFIGICIVLKICY